VNERATGIREAKKVVIELLRSRSKKARFVTEVSALLQRSNLSAEEVERVLAELEAEGGVMIRDHYCADPHLASVDLRIVAVVDSSAGADPQLDAIREIDSAWDKWLADYLSNHRCG
jgi:DNA-binding IclR family transcriptional regulator